MIKSFSIFKVQNKKSDKDPDYRISAKIGEEYKEIGAGWIKDGKSGKYVSCQLSKPYKDRKGFQIVFETTPDPTLGEVDESVIDPDKIDF